jgi:Domain of unknown function (DUF4129)
VTRFCKADLVPGRQGVRPAALAGVVLLLFALALVALTARSGRTETVTAVTSPAPTVTLPPKTGVPRPPDGGETKSPEAGYTAPAAFGPLVTIAAVFIIVILATFTWIVVERVRMSPGRFRRYRAPLPPRLDGAPPPADPAVLAAAVEAGLRELEDGSPGEGVVACWVQLERAAEEAGAGRAAPETPSELAGRLIDTHGVEAGPLVRLAELYREARYSAHPVQEGARAEARSLLEEVRADLALGAASLAVHPRRVP